MANIIRSPLEFVVTTTAVIISTRYLINTCIKKTTKLAKQRIPLNSSDKDALKDKKIFPVTNPKAHEISISASRFGEPSNR